MVLHCEAPSCARVEGYCQPILSTSSSLRILPDPWRFEWRVPFGAYETSTSRSARSASA